MFHGYLQLSFLIIVNACHRITARELWTVDENVNDLLPREIKSASLISVHAKGVCSLLSQRQNGSTGFFYKKDKKICLPFSQIFEKDILKQETGYRFYRLPSLCHTVGDYIMDTQAGSCYSIHTDAVTWHNARDACANQNGRLAVLDTSQKLAFFMTYLRQGNSEKAGLYFIGAHRPWDMWNTFFPGGQPDHIWLNGRSVDWASAEPYKLPSEPSNDNGGENTIIVYKNVNSATWHIGDHWDTASCFYICEHPLY